MPMQAHGRVFGAESVNDWPSEPSTPTHFQSKASQLTQSCVCYTTRNTQAQLYVGFSVFSERYTSRVRLRWPNSVHTVALDSKIFKR